VTLLLVVAALVMLLFTLTAYMPARPNLAIDLPSHFMTQYANGSAILFIAAIFFGAYPALPFLMAAFLLSVFQLSPYLPKRQLPKAVVSLKILQANVLKSNQNPELLRQLVMEEQPDIVTCAEVNPNFAAMLEGMKADYPHQFITTGNGSYRVAVLSKQAFTQVEQTAFGGPRTEAVVFGLTHEGKEIRMVSMHPFTPNANILSRDGEFEAVAKRFAAEKPERLLIMGDFNATPWCPAMKKLMRALKLRNAREGRGISTSWPAFLPFLMRIPIDHVLVSANLGIASFRTGPFIGSDHLPTLTRVYIPST
jgi:endonuclease/exonuclease/phosphatase (EEP) superfamily protein YafD